MAEKKAGVRLEAKDSGFRRTLLGTEGAVKDSARRMGSAYSSSISAGMKGGFDSVKSMLSTLKSGMMGLMGIAGGLGMASLVKGAIESESKFRQLAFTLGAGKGEIADWRDLQKQAGQSALDWSQRSEDLADAMDAVFNTVGDAKYASATLDEIAKAAQASGHRVETIAPIVAEMNRQFGVTAQEVPEALAAVLSLSARGGLSIKDTAANMGKLGRLAGIAGLQGREGMQMLLGLTNQIIAASGNAEGSVEKLNMMITKLADAATVKKQLGIDVAGLGAVEALGKVLAKTKGDASGLTKVFGEQGAMFAQAFGRRFEDVFKAAGGTPEQKLQAAVDDFHAAMKKASSSALSAADVQKRAEENNKSAQSGIQRAIETMQQAFEKPEMQEAISSLAQNLPALAEAVAKAVDWIVKHPTMAAGAIVGGKMAMGAIGSAGTAAAIERAMLGGGASAGKSIAGEMTTAGSTIGANLKGALVAGGAQAAAAIGVSLAVDQATKLADDLEQRQKDIADERANMLEIAERQGESYAVREKHLSEYTAEDVFGKAGGKEYITRGPRGEVRVSGVKPQEGAVSVPFEEAPMSYEQRRMIERATPSMFAAPERRVLSFEEIDRRLARQAQQKPADHAAAARAMAEAVGNRTLNVKVTNVNELRTPAGGGGPPTPGYQER